MRARVALLALATALVALMILAAAEDSRRPG